MSKPETFLTFLKLMEAEAPTFTLRLGGVEETVHILDVRRIAPIGNCIEVDVIDCGKRRVYRADEIIAGKQQKTQVRY